ncbi:MAG: hypothetical protein LBM99_02260 [Bacillales bacterium]|jgi:hypothetical protein|nr:hypothetical protein [Bacillales bacterium]
MNKYTQTGLRLFEMLPANREFLDLLVVDGELPEQLIEFRAKRLDSLRKDPIWKQNYELNGKNGAELEADLNQLYDDVFVNKKMLNVIDGKIYADKQYRMPLLDMIIKLYQRYTFFINSLLKQNEESKEFDLDTRFNKLIELERYVWGLALARASFKLILDFKGEFDNEIKQSQGHGTPFMNLIKEDIQKCIGIINYAFGQYKGDLSMNMQKNNQALVKVLQLFLNNQPLEEGKKIGDEINLVLKDLQDNLQAGTRDWISRYQDLHKDFQAEIKKVREAKALETEAPADK